MDAKTDFDITNFDPLSPKSPKRQLYYVESPPRDFYDDGDKSSTMEQTSSCNSPMNSPSHQSYGHHSRASSSSTISGSYRKSNDQKVWIESKVVDEENGDYDDFYHGTNGYSRRVQFFIAVVGFVLVFAVFGFIIWAASLHYKPQFIVKHLTVHNFYFGEGLDLTGVPTKKLTMNCSMRMAVHNPAPFFGIDVGSESVNLMYSEITVATGELKKYHQQRKSRRTVYVNLQGSKVPLYGSSESFASSVDDGKVSMKLDFEVKSRGNVIWKLVRTKHTQHVSCSIVVELHNNNAIKLKDNDCRHN